MRKFKPTRDRSSPFWDLPALVPIIIAALTLTTVIFAVIFQPYGPPPPFSPTTEDLNSPRYADAYNTLSQRWMAVSAVFMAALTIVMSCLSALGVYLLLRTLQATAVIAKATQETNEAALDSANSARMSAEAAEAAVNVTRDMGQAQIQAYVDCVLIKVRIASEPSPGLVTSRSFTLYLQNSGLTAALKVELHFSFEVVDRNNLDEYPNFDELHHHFACRNISPSSASAGSIKSAYKFDLKTAVDLITDNIGVIASKQPIERRYLRFFGQVRYENIFGRRFTTDIDFFVAAPLRDQLNNSRELEMQASPLPPQRTFALELPIPPASWNT